MGRHKRKKKNQHGDDGPIDLNVMPFIDVFSLLTTFLLFSAVFIQIGILEVQVPFLSNSNPPDLSKPQRDLEVKIDLTEDYVEVQTAYSAPPVDEKKDRFDLDEAGLLEMHNKLVELRVANPKVDKLTLYAEDKVKYNVITDVLDQVKFLNENDPKDIEQPDQDKLMTKQTKMYLFPKVIMGSVML